MVARGVVIAAGSIGGGAALAAAFVVGQQTRAGQSAPAVTVTVPASPAPSSPDTAWTALAAGDCLQDFSSAWSAAYRVVACSERHAARVTRVVPLGEAGDDEAVDALSLACPTREGLATAYTWPDGAERNAGSTSGVCFLVGAAS